MEWQVLMTDTSQYNSRYIDACFDQDSNNVFVLFQNPLTNSGNRLLFKVNLEGQILWKEYVNYNSGEFTSIQSVEGQQLVLTGADQGDGYVLFLSEIDGSLIEEHNLP